MTDFETAEKEFDAVQKADPYRMEEVDIYSNMLYVMDKKAKLGKLAHEYAEIDRNRAEVCCLIGKSLSSGSLPPVRRRILIIRKLLFIEIGPYQSHHLL